MSSVVVSTVWIELLRAQRPVRYADVSRALPELSHGQRAMALNISHKLGYIERAGKPREYVYSVTPRCAIPPGVTVKEILEATA